MTRSNAWIKNEAPPADLPADAIPYWRGGLRKDDAKTAAKIAARHLRKRRDDLIRIVVAIGHPPKRAAQWFNVSVSTVRKVLAACRMGTERSPG